MIMRLAFLLVALAAMLAPGAAEPRYGAPAAEFAAHLERLRHAYPKTIKGVDDGALAVEPQQVVPGLAEATDWRFGL
jgi:hypothetical protein